MITIDQYVSDVGMRLKTDRRRTAILLDEVRDHLMEAAEHRADALGEPRERAEDEAVRAFGPASLIARGFSASAGARAMRRAPIVGFVTGASVVTAFLIAAVPQPRMTQEATPAMQISFFVGLLAFQVAVAAGACAASRAAAMWRTSAASGNRRAFVRRGTVISMTVLCIGAMAVATNLILDAGHRSHANGPALAAGATGMIAAAAAGLVTTLRLDVNADDDDVHAGGATHRGLLFLGEWAIAFVNRHPVLCCGVATVAATAWAMSQAEASSIAAALPWGIGEAVTVIVAFVLLGPALGLRSSARLIPPR